jgi:hypothetical protein
MAEYTFKTGHNIRFSHNIIWDKAPRYMDHSLHEVIEKRLQQGAGI